MKPYLRNSALLLLAFGLLLSVVSSTHAQHEEQTLSDGWRFVGGSAADTPGIPIPLREGRWKLSANSDAEAGDVTRSDFDDSTWSHAQPHIGDHSFASRRSI